MQKNEPERLTVKATRDESILSSEDSNSEGDQMKVIYRAVTILRKRINRCKKWVFTGSLEDTEE